MSIKTTIKDGQGTDLEACVKKLPSKENSICTNLSGTSKGVFISTLPFAGGGQKDLVLTQDGLGVVTNAGVDGSATEVVFSITPDESQDFIINDFIIIGIDTGIKLNNWLALNGPLTNGCLLELKADNSYLTFDPFKKTTDLAIFSSKGGFDLLSEQAGDMAKATRIFLPALIIRKKDTFGTSATQQDYIKFTIRDDMASVTDFRIIVRGNLVAPGTV